MSASVQKLHPIARPHHSAVRSLGREQGCERGQARRREQQRAHAQLSGQQLAHDKFALGHEAPAVFAEPPILQIAVVGQSRVVESRFGQEMKVDGHGEGRV